MIPATCRTKGNASAPVLYMAVELSSANGRLVIWGRRRAPRAIECAAHPELFHRGLNDDSRVDSFF